MAEQGQKSNEKRGHPRGPWTEEERKLRAERKALREAGLMPMAKDTPKRDKRGRPPWTQEQKEHYSKVRKANTQKRAEDEWERALPIIEENKRIRRENTQLEPLSEGERKTNARFLREARVGYNLPELDLTDAAAVEQRINDYLDFCEVNDKRPTVTSLANWLGVSTFTMQRWKEGDVNSNRNTSKIVQRIYGLMEEFMVDQLMESKFPTNFIFLLKNMFGYKDQTDLVVGQNDHTDSEVSKEDLEKWFLEDGNKVETTFKEGE